MSWLVPWQRDRECVAFANAGHEKTILARAGPAALFAVRSRKKSYSILAGTPFDILCDLPEGAYASDLSEETYVRELGGFTFAFLYCE
jgi:hypothetical protein